MNLNTINNDVTMRPQAGASLGRIDQYELIRELGGGGFGCVYLAKDTVSGIEVAVKGLPPLVRLNKEELENVRKNFALVSRLHHPNIAAALTLHPITTAFYDDKSDAEKLRVFKGDTLVVMQYAPGVTLSQWRKQFPEGKVPLDKAVEITRQIASALDYAHKERILHRDIKPANVIIETGVDGKITARVLDFGLAAEIRSSMSRVSQSVTDTSGTRPYMAPEQWGGRKQGKETDLYSLAVLFYELVSGEVPFASVFDTGDPVLMMNVIETKNPEISSELSKPIRRALIQALAKKREDRFGSCSEFIDALVGRASGGRTSVLLSHARGLRAAAILTAVAALGLAFGGIWYWQSVQSEVEVLIEERFYDPASEEMRKLRCSDTDKVYVESLLKKRQGVSSCEQTQSTRRDKVFSSETHDKVQLWEGGPYWATKNIGAEKPEDFGYYFWWGDTVGYKRVDGKWVASDGSKSNFSFNSENVPTGKRCFSDDLRYHGWITGGCLASEFDAASVRLDKGWRLPTNFEFRDLANKCDWTLVLDNGANGFVVCGRGDYSSKSIFLPSAGFGRFDQLIDAGLCGSYWSSNVYNIYGDEAFNLYFDSTKHLSGSYTYRYYGLPIRPVQGFAK